jgi:hypothetical protein
MRGSRAASPRSRPTTSARPSAPSTTTGAGSGKSLAYFIPVVDAVLKARASDPRPRTRAIILYPMNALANSQREELNDYLSSYGDAPPVTFGRYTGQEDETERNRLASDPPDILLTNFMMLELLMTRQDDKDRAVHPQCPRTRVSGARRAPHLSRPAGSVSFPRSGRRSRHRPRSHGSWGRASARSVSAVR